MDDPQRADAACSPVGDDVLRRVLVVHNRYQQAGGEDSVFLNEVALLRGAGYEVATLEVSNDEIQSAGARFSAALGVVYSAQGYRRMAQAVADARPDIVHVHNFFPMLSPAIFDACAAAGVPAVWTLHNFRIACANGLLFRDGRPCEDCLGRLPLPAIAHGCYRGSRIGSAAVAAMIGFHQRHGTWKRKVARFIALTDFARDLVIRAGLRPELVAVKPNFIADPLPEVGGGAQLRNGAVFVGRLSPEKGAAVLVDAWRELPHVPLTIIGDGPEKAALEGVSPPHVQFVGHQQRREVLLAVAQAAAIVVPSRWYENFPMTVVEAMALGTPVIASRIGALQSIVTDGANGLLFRAGDAEDLARVAGSAFAQTSRLASLGVAARGTWEQRMSPERNLAQLVAIYRQAIGLPGAEPGNRRAA